STSGATSRDVNAAEELLRPGDDASPAIRVHGDARRCAVGRGELRRAVRQAAAAFARLGVQEEQRVLVALWNGSVPVLVSSFLPGDAYAAFLDESRARAVVTTGAIAEPLGARGT